MGDHLSSGRRYLDLITLISFILKRLDCTGSDCIPTKGFLDAVEFPK